MRGLNPRECRIDVCIRGDVYFRWQADSSGQHPLHAYVFLPFSVGFPPLHPRPASFRHLPSASSEGSRPLGRFRPFLHPKILCLVQLMFGLSASKKRARSSKLPVQLLRLQLLQSQFSVKSCNSRRLIWMNPPASSAGSFALLGVHERFLA